MANDWMSDVSGRIKNFSDKMKQQVQKLSQTSSTPNTFPQQTSVVSRVAYQMEKLSDNFIRITGEVRKEEINRLIKTLSIYSNLLGIELQVDDISIAALPLLQDYCQKHNLAIRDTCGLLHQTGRIPTSSHSLTKARVSTTNPAQISDYPCRIFSFLDVNERYCLVRLTGKANRDQLERVQSEMQKMQSCAEKKDIPIVLVVDGLDADGGGMNGLTAIILAIKVPIFLVGASSFMMELFGFYQMEKCMVFKNSLEDAVKAIEEGEQPGEILDQESKTLILERVKVNTQHIEKWENADEQSIEEDENSPEIVREINRMTRNLQRSSLDEKMAISTSELRTNIAEIHQKLNILSASLEDISDLYNFIHDLQDFVRIVNEKILPKNENSIEQILTADSSQQCDFFLQGLQKVAKKIEEDDEMAKKMAPAMIKLLEEVTTSEKGRELLGKLSS